MDESGWRAGADSANVFQARPRLVVAIRMHTRGFADDGAVSAGAAESTSSSQTRPSSPIWPANHTSLLRIITPILKT